VEDLGFRVCVYVRESEEEREREREEGLPPVTSATRVRFARGTPTFAEAHESTWIMVSRPDKTVKAGKYKIVMAHIRQSRPDETVKSGTYTIVTALPRHSDFRRGPGIWCRVWRVATIERMWHI